jgi:hypothetical protein
VFKGMIHLEEFYAKAQVFPWLQATLKYTEGTFKKYRPTN